MTMLNDKTAAPSASTSSTTAPQNAPRYKGKTGAKILHEMLVQQHKVELMFGYPGGAILPVFDELYKTPAKFILNRHEQSSGHCADGYSRATGKPGICIVTSGPGATNTVTPLATAQMDSVPIIVFSGQVATKVIGNDAFQEADVTGITRPCTKWNYLVKDIRELPRVINEAFTIATSGRPGPVLIDLPKDITSGICPEEPDDTPRRISSSARPSPRTAETRSRSRTPPRRSTRRKSPSSTSAAARLFPAPGRPSARSPKRETFPAPRPCWAWARLTKWTRQRAWPCWACTAALTRTTPSRNAIV